MAAASTVQAPPQAPRNAHDPAGRWGRAALVLAPLLAAAAGYLLVLVFASPRAANQALLAGAIFLTVVGPSVIFGAAGFDALGTWQVVAVVAFFSLLTSFFYAFNLDLLERIPKLGGWLRRVRLNTRRTLSERPWIRRWATFGVGFFVLLPLPGSGTLGGSLMGRLVGLTPRATFGAVGGAGVLVSVAYGGFGVAIRDLPMWVQCSIGGVMIVALAFVGRWLVRQGRRDGGKTPAPARQAPGVTPE
jgi:uncharacterized membrane protein